MNLRRSLPVVGLAALAIGGTVLVRPALAAPATPAAPAQAVQVAQVAAPAAAALPATHPVRYAATSPVRAIQAALGVTQDGKWGAGTDRAMWAFEATVYMQWPNHAAKVAALQRAFNLAVYPPIAVDGAWGAQTEYAMRGIRTRYYMKF